MQPQIVEKAELRVVGLEAAFISGLSPDATNFTVIGTLWDRFFRRAGEVLHKIGGPMYGVIFSGPETARKHPDEMQYLAGVPVSTLDDVPEGMIGRTVPAGCFAVFTHRGPIRNFGETLHEIYRVWLPQSGHEHAQIADIEMYDRRFSPDSADSEMEYWISISPRTVSCDARSSERSV